MILERNNTSQKIIATIKNKDAIDQYKCAMAVCHNPLCTCGVVELNLTPVPEEEKSIPTTTKRMVSLDIFKKSLGYGDENNIASEDLAFAKDFIRALDEDDYQILQKEHLAQKKHLTEQADINDINAYFPMKEIEEEGRMIEYNETLPYADHLPIKISNHAFLMIDRYCVRTTCSCTDTIISYLLIDKSRKPKKELFAYSVNYNTQKWKKSGQFIPGLKRNVPNINTVKKAVEEKYPEFYGILQERHAQLRKLYANYRRKQGFSPPSEPAVSNKIGRNEPCPCGSGKKYKKCCLISP